MKFKKFSSLENTYKQKVIDNILFSDQADQSFVVTEKLHGANFSFYFEKDGSEQGCSTKVGSRNQFVDSGFYNCGQVVTEVMPNFISMCHTLGVDNAIMYGELYGEGIFTEVVYGKKDFAAFDLHLDFGNGLTPVSKLDFFELMTNHGIHHVPFLGVFDLKGALGFNEEFITKVGNQTEDNYAEGVVIEPIKPAWFGSGSRMYLKKKASKFSEKRGTKAKTPKTFDEIVEGDRTRLLELLTYVTEQRVMNVVSKHGQVTNKDFGIIMKAFVEDVIEESELDTFQYENWGSVKKQFNKACAETVRKVFVTLL
jgi:Rnl2 family RNA ligase